jgi:hypothetical protein
MNPKPFASLNHFTVPLAICSLLSVLDGDPFLVGPGRRPDADRLGN